MRPLAFDDYRLHVCGVAGEGLHRDAGNDFFAAFEQRHLAAQDQRIVVLGDVADRVALAGVVRVLPFAFRCVIFRAGKGGDDLSVFSLTVFHPQ